ALAPRSRPLFSVLPLCSRAASSVGPARGRHHSARSLKGGSHLMDLSIPFLGAQLVLVLVLWAVHHVVRRPPNLAGRLRTLDDVTDVEMWIKHGLDELRRSLADLAGLHDRKAKLEQRSRASRGLGVGWAQRVFMLAFLGGTWLLLYESESAIGVILNLT